jgi:hypothetical protein
VKRWRDFDPFWVPWSVRQRPWWIRAAWIAMNPVASSPLWRVKPIRRALVNLSARIVGR